MLAQLSYLFFELLRVYLIRKRGKNKRKQTFTSQAFYTIIVGTLA
jgi:hypothetical protein